MWLYQAIFFLLGVGILVPWNAYISAKAYFESRLCDEYYQKHLESTFAIGYNSSSVLTLGLLIAVQWLSDRRRHPPPPVQGNSSAASTTSSSAPATSHSFYLVVLPLSIYLLVFVGQTVAVAWVSMPQRLFYYWTVSSLSLCGVCGALATSGILATASGFAPAVGVEPFLAGQSAGGLGVALANFAAAALGDANVFWKARCLGQDDDDSGEDHGNPFATPTVRSTSPRLLVLESSTTRALSQCTSRMDPAVLCYFLLGSIVLAACIVGYCHVDGTTRRRQQDYETVADAEEPPCGEDSTRMMMTQFPEQSPPGLELNTTARLRRRQEESLDSHDTTNPLTRESGSPNGTWRRRQQQQMSSSSSSLEQDSSTGPNGALIPQRQLTQEEDDVQFTNETTHVLYLVRYPALTIYIIFMVTLALFPAWLSRLVSIHQCRPSRTPLTPMGRLGHRLVNDLYTPLAFVVFNAGDLTGRILSAYLPMDFFARNQWRPTHTLLQWSLLRFLFVPLLYLCTSQYSLSHWDDDDNNDDDTHRWTVPSDVYSWVIQIVFAVSNGFVASTAFIVAPQLLPPHNNNVEIQERSAEILTFCLSFGLLSGSFLSVPVTNLFSSSSSLS